MAALAPTSIARQISTFQRALLRWYRRHGRDLPWRRTRDPYKILVSEIMLQQTQVDRVIPKYHEFLTRYPTLNALASARQADVRKVWYPLGYNVRPKRLHQIAKTVLDRHAGQVPNTYDGLIAMDGIGRYTAGAVLSFAFEQDAPILDTNVARLLQRYFGLRPGAGRPQGHLQQRLWSLAGRVIPPGQGYDINQGMMDFGALICTAKAPKCLSCALRRSCKSFPYAPHYPSRRRAD